MKRILLILACIIAGATVASLAGASSATNPQPQLINETATPNGTAPTAASTAVSTDSASAPVASSTSTPTISPTTTPTTTPTATATATPNGTAPTAASTAVSTDSASTPVASSTSTASPSTATPEPTATRTPVPGTNLTGPAGAPSVELVVDEHVAITHTAWSDGTFRLRIYADTYTSITLLASPDADSQQGTAEFESRVLRKDTTTTVRIDSNTGVTAWTDESARDGRVVYLRKPSQSIVSGPYDGTDVRNAGIGGAAGVAIAVLYEAVAAKLGAENRFQRQV
jgi:cytoskeletal protein RodZ